MNRQEAQDLLREQLRARLATDHTYHRPHGDQAERYERIRSAARFFGELLVDLAVPSRELSTALTKVEEAVFHANASIARHEPAPTAEPAP